MASVNRETVETMANTIKFASFVEYDEYLSLMCPEDYHVKQLIRDRGLSLGFGVSHLKPYFLMKSDFKKWFLFEINDLQRERFTKFVDDHKAMLLDRFKLSVETEINNMTKDNTCCSAGISFIS